ncbi:uncharacterized protein TNCV_1210391 [Trichonephila clavipes]|nr:uncharacterized protein TNCV_1210391 [Trichonephila clavipes]
MVWGAIAYNTRSPPSIDPGPAVCPGHPATTYVATHATASWSHFFNKTILGHTGQGCHNTVFTLLLSFLGLLDPRFVSNRAYLGSFGMASWASHEFERTRGKVTANMERNVSRHHTESVCLNARSYRIVYSR